MILLSLKVCIWEGGNTTSFLVKARIDTRSQFFGEMERGASFQKDIWCGCLNVFRENATCTVTNRGGTIFSRAAHFFGQLEHVNK